MEILRKSSSLTLAFLLLAACNGQGASEQARNSGAAEANNAEPEAPAPVQAAGKSFLYNFDGDAVGKLPAKFHAALTGQGARSEWVIKADPTAPSPPNVLAQISNDRTDYRFP